MTQQSDTPNEATKAEATPLSATSARSRDFTHTKKKSESWSNVLSTIAVLLLAPLIALFLTAFVFQSYQVDGQSMEPTLHHGDRLIVWKLPGTWARITGHDYLPKRGDVVIFAEHAVANYGLDQSKQLIKRVIGLPGERVTIKDGVVTIYNNEHPSGFQPDKTLPYGSAIETETPGDTDTIIGDHQVFVLGDNRDNSLDSSEFGPIVTKDIIGKLVLRILPIDKFERF